MEEQRNFKRKIIKGSIGFLGIMLGLTILSKTIYTLLLPQVTLAKVSQETVENKLFAVGKIGLDSLTIRSQKIAIKMPVEGRIVQCLAEENQRIKKGEPLFKLQVQVDEKEVAEARRDEAEHRITKESLARQKEEKLNKKSEVEEEIVSQNKQNEKNGISYKVLQIEQQIKNQEEQQLLNKELYLEGMVSQTEYKKGQQLLELLKKEKQEVEKEEQEKRESKLQALQEKLKTLNSELNELEEKQALEESKFSIKEAMEKEIMITSPINGVLYERNLSVGNQASQGEQLGAMIPDNVPITLSFKVNEGQANAIRLEQEVAWTLNGETKRVIVTKKTYDETSSETIIMCKLKEETMKDLDLGFKAYQTVDVEITNHHGQYDLVVPNTALIREGIQTYVYGLEEIQRTFEVTYCVNKIPVTVIKEGDNKSAVSGALSNQQEIIRTTSKPLKEGIEVVIN